ncbi:MAG: response regulator transcription factor [Alphaproteobacteria bacterium]|nr:response regulator transcription factor [Alphaproteobacteria bacterium]
MPAEILLIEDDTTLGWLLRDELRAAGYRCRWVDTAADGLTELAERPPALVLLDLMLPDRSGFAVIREVRKAHAVPIIVVSSRASSEDKIEALDLGADDYVTKPFSAGELLARIRARLRTRDPKPAARMAFGAVAVDRPARRVTVAGTPCALTPTELDVLLALLDRAGETVLHEDLAAEVLPGQDVSERAVHTHVSRLRRKLGADGARIETVWGLGYRLDA